MFTNAIIEYAKDQYSDSLNYVRAIIIESNTDTSKIDASCKIVDVYEFSAIFQAEILENINERHIIDNLYYKDVKIENNVDALNKAYDYATLSNDVDNINELLSIIEIAKEKSKRDSNNLINNSVRFLSIHNTNDAIKYAVNECLTNRANEQKMKHAYNIVFAFANVNQFHLKIDSLVNIKNLELKSFSEM